MAKFPGRPGRDVDGMCPTAMLNVFASTPSRTMADKFSRGIATRPSIDPSAGRLSVDGSVGLEFAIAPGCGSARKGVRSEERRVGKEWRFLWCAERGKNKRNV